MSRGVSEARRSLRAPRLYVHSARGVVLAGSIALAGATWWTARRGVYDAPVVFGWLLSLASWLWVWWPSSRIEDRRSKIEVGGSGVRSMYSPSSILHPRNIVLLALIIAVGAFFRFYRLADVPHDPTSDHAEKLLDVLDLLHGQRPIFFVRNTGREPAQFYLAFAMIRGFGFPLSWDTLKWGTALVGLLAVPAIYLVGRELWSSSAGLWASALFAIAKWPVNISRMGLRYPLAILPAALVIWLLLRYLRRPDRRDALWCGVVLGFGMHGYISFRVVPLLVPAALGAGLLLDRRLRRAWPAVLADGTLIAATALLACLPLARYAVDHPDFVWFRVATRVSDAERPIGSLGENVLRFVDNNRRALLAFNVRGDSSSINAVAYDPFLDPVTGVAFVAGTAIAAYQAVRRRDSRFALLLLALPLLLLPSTLSIAFPNENPSANRLGVAAAVVFPLAALPFALLPGRVGRPVVRAAVLAALVLTLLPAARHNYLRYFRDYDAGYRARVPATRAIAASIKQRMAEGIALEDVYILGYPYWLDGRNIAFALGDITWVNEHDVPPDAPLPVPRTGAPLLLLVNPADRPRLDQLRHAYPNGTEELFVAPSGHAYQLYTVR